MLYHLSFVLLSWILIETFNVPCMCLFQNFAHEKDTQQENIRNLITSELFSIKWPIYRIEMNVSKNISGSIKIIIIIIKSNPASDCFDSSLAGIYFRCVTPLNICCSICEYHGIQHFLRRQRLHGDLG